MKEENRGEAKRCAPSGKERKAGDQRVEGAKGRAYLLIFARLSRSQSDSFGSSTLRRVLQMPPPALRLWCREATYCGRAGDPLEDPREAEREGGMSGHTEEREREHDRQPRTPPLTLSPTPP